MSTFDRDSDQGSVQPVYLLLKGQPLLQIFTTQYTQKNHCALLGSPSEKGLKMFDNKVIQPTTIQFTGIVKHSMKSVFNAIRTFMKSNELSQILCQFQTKAGRVEKMIIESIEEIGESSRYDGMEIRVSLQEYLEHGIIASK